MNVGYLEERWDAYFAELKDRVEKTGLSFSEDLLVISDYGYFAPVLTIKCSNVTEVLNLLNDKEVVATSTVKKQFNDKLVIEELVLNIAYDDNTAEKGELGVYVVLTNDDTFEGDSEPYVYRVTAVNREGLSTDLVKATVKDFVPKQ